MTDEIPPILQGTSNFLIDDWQTAVTTGGIMVNTSLQQRITGLFCRPA
jgi:hypothetical protein